MLDLSVKIGDVTLKNPIVTASGTFGFGREYGKYFDLNELGAVSVKGLTLEPRSGNAAPRIAETPAGILNSVGLQNPGVHRFIEEEIPFLRKYSCKIIANMAGSTIDDYCRMAEILGEADVDLLEMNISCPNVKEGGVAFGTNADTVYEITQKVKACAKQPLIVKLSPNVTSIQEMAHAAEAGGADALSLINTLLGMAIDIHTKRPILANNMGGLSGPAVKPVAVRMVYQVRQCTNLPIIGMGGISNGDDAIEIMLAGANAVALGTAMFADPMAPVKTLRGIEAYMKANNMEKIADLSGKVQVRG